MRIENQMLSRFNTQEKICTEENNISNELDFFFNNIMDSVVEFFQEREEIKL